MVWISLGAMSISGHDLRAGTAENYRVFAAEAHGRSALYAELATAVADDPLVLTFLDKLLQGDVELGADCRSSHVGVYVHVPSPRF